MATVNLSATARTERGKGAARKLRSSGQVPAIIYGSARDAQPLAINEKDLDRLLGTIAAESTVIELGVDGGRPTKTLIREITVTDTIAIAPERRFETLTVLSVGDLLSKAIRYTHAEQSVSSLFD